MLESNGTYSEIPYKSSVVLSSAMRPCVQRFTNHILFPLRDLSKNKFPLERWVKGKNRERQGTRRVLAGVLLRRALASGCLRGDPVHLGERMKVVLKKELRMEGIKAQFGNFILLLVVFW